MDVEWAKLAVTLSVAAAGGGWAVWTWSGQQQEDRRAERSRLFSMYLNPFIIAAEDLQSRLYNILAKGGLGPLRERHPDGAYAEETLHLFAMYFAYEQQLLRFTPFGGEPRIRALIMDVRDDLATDSFGLDPWVLFRPTQRELGRRVLALRKGPDGEYVDTLSLADFTAELAKGLADDLKLADALVHLKGATRVDDLDKSTQRRWCRAQQHLADILDEFDHEMLRPRRFRRASPPSDRRRCVEAP
jgi:hypothetical protein